MTRERPAGNVPRKEANDRLEPLDDTRKTEVSAATTPAPPTATTAAPSNTPLLLLIFPAPQTEAAQKPDPATSHHVHAESHITPTAIKLKDTQKFEPRTDRFARHAGQARDLSPITESLG
ncbi:hypothetical protein GCM10010433_16520 [Streptomyces pulveraceus]